MKHQLAGGSAIDSLAVANNIAGLTVKNMLGTTFYPSHYPVLGDSIAIIVHKNSSTAGYLKLWIFSRASK